MDDADMLLEPDEGAPICGACGVTALPGDGEGFVCENPDCEAYGEPVHRGAGRDGLEP